MRSLTITRQRLNFIVILFLGALFSGALHAAVPSIKARKGMNLVGRVTVDGKPRKGVVVSDGVNVVTTDSKGVYQMSTSGRQHVFVSVPADCEVPVKDGFPYFYQELDSAITPGVPYRHDFELKSTPVKHNWKLVAIADPQIGVPDTLDYSGIVVPQIQEYVSTLGPNTYGLTLGDLIWNAPQLYPTYKNETSRVGIPVFSVIGNHDHNEHVHNDTESDRDFRNAVGPTYYSVNIGDCHIVALDDVLYRGEKNRNAYSGAITQAQLAWLKKDLEHVSKDKTIIVGLHIPTSRRNAPWKVENHELLYEMLRPYKSAEILSGHTHYHFTTTIAPNITETTLGAAMGAFWYPLNGDGSPRGFAVLEFDGATLKDKYYIGAGMPRSYQMKLYKPDEAVLWDPAKNTGDPYEDILINIFCWHTDWTVEVSEDGAPFTTLGADARLLPGENGGKCWDPAVRQCMVNGRIPANHGGSKPTDINDHMFLYRPAANWKKVTVKASDPYGNVYTEILENN